MEAMTIDERRKYLARMEPRYRQAERVQQGQLLDEMEAMTGLHRKSLLRLLRVGGLVRHPRRQQRGRVYGSEVDDALRVIWESLDYICAERLTPALLPTAWALAHHGELHLPPDLEAQLGQISIATVQRCLTRFGQDSPRLPRKRPAAANRVAQAIPMGRIPWDQPEPGHLEVDLVHHSGPATVGDYVHTLQLIDVATGWSERVAVLGRSYRAMSAGFEHLLERLPFAVRELHPDNGPEFLNAHLVRFWGARLPGLTLSRSRPYHKNDNRFVEQKNSSLVRAYLGNIRLDTPDQCADLNALYEQMWLYYNLFQPVLHLVEKTAVGTQVRRRWDTAQTPYERLAATGALTASEQAPLDGLYQTANPRALRREIYTHLDAILLPRPPARTEPAA